jgi:hypothetical protein
MNRVAATGWQRYSMPPMKKSERVFISHGLAESSLAQELAEALTQEGVRVTEPATEVLQGDNFAESIASALKGADHMIVLLTPNSVKSPLLQNEIAYALNRPRFKDHVIPVITGKVTSYPWILRQMEPISLHNDIAVTASDLAKRFHNAKSPLKRAVKRRRNKELTGAS